MKIYKSNFSAEELAQWEALVAKGMVAPEEAQEEMEEQIPETPAKKPTKKAEVEDMEKSASPEIKAALEELQELKKSIEMKDMTEIAKKYAPLGKKEAELAQTLYDMKKSSPANYEAYVAILDESLGMVEKSGLFTEVGKSAGGYSTAGGAVAKVEAAANEIMKSDASMTREEAIAKAWIDNPEFVREYEAEYKG
jgi:hypothetical protein